VRQSEVISIDSIKSSARPPQIPTASYLQEQDLKVQAVNLSSIFVKQTEDYGSKESLQPQY